MSISEDTLGSLSQVSPVALEQVVELEQFTDRIEEYLLEEHRVLYAEPGVTTQGPSWGYLKSLLTRELVNFWQ